jgi:site-specific recombinase XerD
MTVKPQDDHDQDERLVAGFIRYEGMENRSPRTRRTNGYVLGSLSRFLNGRGKTILTAERDDIRSYLWRGQRKNRTKQGELCVIRSMYKWLRISHGITSDPTIFISVERD